MSVMEKSDLLIVAMKRENKAASAAAEPVERRGGAKGHRTPHARRIDRTPPWGHHQAPMTRTFHNATVSLASRSDFRRFRRLIRSISSRAARLSRSSL
jgi:hypothetical protein